METMRLMGERTRRHWTRWGFVVYKSPHIQDDAKWLACRQRFEQIIDDANGPYLGYEGLEECCSRMKFHWVEDVPAGEGDVAQIAL